MFKFHVVYLQTKLNYLSLLTLGIICPQGSSLSQKAAISFYSVLR